MINYERSAEGGATPLYILHELLYFSTEEIEFLQRVAAENRLAAEKLGRPELGPITLRNAIEFCEKERWRLARRGENAPPTLELLHAYARSLKNQLPLSRRDAEEEKLEVAAGEWVAIFPPRVCAPLFKALKGCDDGEISSLIRTPGFAPNAKDEKGNSYLMIAVEEHQPLEIIEELGARGTNPNARNYKGETVAHTIVKIGCNAKGSRGREMLGEKGRRVFECLVSYGLDPLVRDKNGFTALQLLQQQWTEFAPDELGFLLQDWEKSQRGEYQNV